MIYYGIVDKIKTEHKCGIYGRQKLDKQEYAALLENLPAEIFSWKFLRDSLTGLPGVVWAINGAVRGALKKQEKIVLTTPLKSEVKQIIFDNKGFEGNYSIENSRDLFYGLFDDFLFPNQAFENILRSKGGSTLVIIERNSLPSSMHFGGQHGRHSLGLYCQHPKDDNILLPLNNSNELIKSLILEETIRAFEALGAKKIIIEDITQIEAEGGGTKKGVKVKLDAEYNNRVLREKTFYKGTFDPERALRNNLFIHDIPAVMTTIQGRINGTQASDDFAANVNLSVGLDVGVLDLFKVNAGFNYNRTWKFNIEFYEKEEISVTV